MRTGSAHRPHFPPHVKRPAAVRPGFSPSCARLARALRIVCCAGSSNRIAVRHGRSGFCADSKQDHVECGHAQHRTGGSVAKATPRARLSISHSLPRFTGQAGHRVSSAPQGYLRPRLLLAWASVPMGEVAEKPYRLLDDQSSTQPAKRSARDRGDTSARMGRACRMAMRDSHDRERASANCAFSRKLRVARTRLDCSIAPTKYYRPCHALLESIFLPVSEA